VHLRLRTDWGWEDLHDFGERQPGGPGPAAALAGVPVPAGAAEAAEPEHPVQDKVLVPGGLQRADPRFTEPLLGAAAGARGPEQRYYP